MVIKRAERQAREDAAKKSGDGSGGVSGGSDGKGGDGKSSDRSQGGSGRRSKHAGRMSSRRKKYRRNEFQQMQKEEVRVRWRVRCGGRGQKTDIYRRFEHAKRSLPHRS